VFGVGLCSVGESFGEEGRGVLEASPFAVCREKVGSEKRAYGEAGGHAQDRSE
jgi:hypothetical protein